MAEQIENIDDVREWVSGKLRNEIDLLESRRKSYSRHSKYTIVLVISILFHLPVFFIKDNLARSIAHQLVFLLNLICSYFVFFKFKGDERLFFDYRKKIIPVLLKEINPEYRYYPRGKILAKEFVSSGLYYNKVNRLIRRDLILGMAQKAAFSLSYVKAQTREVFGRSGITQSSTSSMITHFQGLHYVFKIPFELQGKTIILPLEKTSIPEVNEVNQRNLQIRSQNPKTHRMFTGNAEFDRYFAVFTSFEKDARRFLNPKRIQDILEINGLFRNTIALSFFSSFVFLHAHTNREVFRLDSARPVDVEQVTANYLNLKIALKAVDLLMH